MPNVRLEHANKGKWWLPKSRMRHAYAYALMYNDWLKEYFDLTHLKGKVADGMPTGSSGGRSEVEENAIRAAELSYKIKMIEDTARKADPEISEYVRLAVTTEGVTFSMLQGKGIPCCRKKYYEARRKFYFLLAKRI